MSMALTACGETESEKETKAPAEKNFAVGTMREGEYPVDFKIDVSTGLSVVFYNDGFSLFEGEFDDSTPPLATATILTEEVYDKYISDNKDKEDFKEEFGISEYTSSLGEICWLYKIGDKIPFMISLMRALTKTGLMK